MAIISKDVIHKLLDSVCGSHTNFSANERFYIATKINCRRWAKLYKGELTISIDELATLCKYLNIDFNTDVFAKQLNLFSSNERI